MLCPESIIKHSPCFLVSVESGGIIDLMTASILFQNVEKGSGLQDSQGAGRLLIIPFGTISSRLGFAAAAAYLFHAIIDSHWGPLLQSSRQCHTPGTEIHLCPTSAVVCRRQCIREKLLSPDWDDSSPSDNFPSRRIQLHSRWELPLLPGVRITFPCLFASICGWICTFWPVGMGKDVRNFGSMLLTIGELSCFSFYYIGSSWDG